MIEELDVVLDTFSEEEISQRWHDIWGSDNIPVKMMDRLYMALDWLVPIDRAIITELYLDGSTFEQVGKNYGCSRSKLFGLVSNILKKLEILIRFRELLPKAEFKRRLAMYVSKSERTLYYEILDNFSYKSLTDYPAFKYKSVTENFKNLYYMIEDPQMVVVFAFILENIKKRTMLACTKIRRIDEQDRDSSSDRGDTETVGKEGDEAKEQSGSEEGHCEVRHSTGKTTSKCNNTTRKTQRKASSKKA